MTDRHLQGPTRLVLTALADEPRHGYAILQEVLAITEGRTRMLTGTLYTALDRLLHQGLVQVDHEEVVNGRLRRNFALTEQGRHTLAEETRRLRAGAAEAERRLALGATLRPTLRQALRQTLGPTHGPTPRTHGGTA